MSNKSSLVEENPTPASSLHSISSNLQSSHDTAVEDAWQEKVQREGIRLEDEPWYMTLPVAIKCRKGKAYYEKRAREDLDPREAQRAQSNVDWGNLIEEQIMYAGSGERKRIGPEAARVREEQFVSETEALSRRILHEADARNEDAQRKRRCKRKKRTQKTQPGSSTEPVTPPCSKSLSKKELTLQRARRQLLQPPPHQDWSLAVTSRQNDALCLALLLSYLERKE